MLDAEEIVAVRLEAVDRNRRSSDVSSRLVRSSTLCHLHHVLCETRHSLGELLVTYVLRSTGRLLAVLILFAIIRILALTIIVAIITSGIVGLGYDSVEGVDLLLMLCLFGCTVLGCKVIDESTLVLLLVFLAKSLVLL